MGGGSAGSRRAFAAYPAMHKCVSVAADRSMPCKPMRPSHEALPAPYSSTHAGTTESVSELPIALHCPTEDRLSGMSAASCNAGMPVCNTGWLGVAYVHHWRRWNRTSSRPTANRCIGSPPKPITRTQPTNLAAQRRALNVSTPTVRPQLWATAEHSNAVRCDSTGFCPTGNAREKSNRIALAHLTHRRCAALRL